MNLDEFYGHFNILDYRLSLGLLLLRATNVVDEEPVNTDILFYDVSFIEIPHQFDNIRIEEGNEDDFTYVRDKCWFTLYREFSTVFVLHTAGKRYYVAAANYQVNINNMIPLSSSIPDIVPPGELYKRPPEM